MSVCMYVGMYVRMHVCLYACMSVCLYVCMYVCLCVCTKCMTLNPKPYKPKCMICTVCTDRFATCVSSCCTLSKHGSPATPRDSQIPKLRNIPRVPFRDL